MSKNIWIFNHYATNMFFENGGRHYWFAENLISKGYNVSIFAATSRHNSNENIDTKDKKYKIENNSKIPFIFVKAPSYEGNGKERIINMISFYKNLFPTSEHYARINGKPDVIIASSVHPLTLVAGIKIAKKFKIPCICEVRDLWPESIVAYGILKKENPITKILYLGEKWIYKKSDYIIMTWEGGKDYIIDQGWEKQVNINKIKHISNGVVLKDFDENSKLHKIEDPELDDKTYKKIIYTGSIRKVNNIGMLLDTAKVIKDKGHNNIRFFIYGSGSELKFLERRCKDEHIDNVIFKGRVEKKYIPSILKKADINILHNSSTSLDKYGQSQNKLFEYLAAGKCIIQTYSTGYNILEKYNCGVVVKNQHSEEIAKDIIETLNDDERCSLLGNNARKICYEFDFENLTNKLIDIIEGI